MKVLKAGRVFTCLRRGTRVSVKLFEALGHPLAFEELRHKGPVCLRLGCAQGGVPTLRDSASSRRP